MKPKRLAELKALVTQANFKAWWEELTRARTDVARLEQRYDELLAETSLTEFRSELTQKSAIDTLYRADACEDAAANMVFEATELENRSFRAIADFEEQRFKASEAWYRLGATEKNLDEKREALAQDSGKKGGAELHGSERSYQQAIGDYEREMERKNRLWDEVERIWARSAEVSLLVAEQKLRAKRIRRKAERAFALAESHTQKAKELRAESERAQSERESVEKKIALLLDQAREQFACAAGAEFLYFRQKDNQKLAFSVALVDDPDTYNVEVKPLHIYTVDRQRGAAFLEPAVADAPSAEEGDRRFEEYFLKGRKGKAKAVEA